MALYGNILTVFNTNETELANVDRLLNYMGLPYKMRETTYYIGTEKKAQTRDLERRLSTFVGSYIFHHIGVSDGSMTKGKGMDIEMLDSIEDIFHNYVEAV
jgi:hypothetical protein